MPSDLPDFLWFDDIRLPPSKPDRKVHWARTIEEGMMVINTIEIVECSLDHDLGLHEFDPYDLEADARRVPARYLCYHCDALTWERGLNIPPTNCSNCHAGPGALSKQEVPDGVEFAKWLVKNHKVPPVVTLHSMNDVGAENMRRVLHGHASTLIVKSFERWK